MSTLADVPSIDGPDFIVQLRREEPVELVLSGSADNSATEPLYDLVSRLHDALSNEGVRRVLVDLQGLEFMSASAFNSIVGWLAKLVELPAAQRYNIQFVANPKVAWQQRSLQTLACFATDVVSVATGEDDGGAT